MSETRTANNLLLCWCLGFAAATLPTTPSGWTVAKQLAGASDSATLFYKIAAGSDAAPTIAAATGVTWEGRLAEFSGNATTSPVDQTGSGSSTGGTLTLTNGAADAATGELMVTAIIASYSTGASKTLTDSYNNGTAIVANNAGATATLHYDLAYAITTASASADSDAFSYTTTKIIEAVGVLASFKLASGGTAITAALTASAAAAATNAEQVAVTGIMT